MKNKIELVCPECNEKFNVDIFTSINVQMDKDMKNRVLVENSLIWNVHIAILNSTFRIQFYITIWKKSC